MKFVEKTTGEEIEAVSARAARRAWRKRHRLQKQAPVELEEAS